MNLVTFYIKLLCNGTKNAYSFKFAHVIPAKKPQVSVQYPAKKLTRHVIECDISQRLTCWRVKTYGRRTMTSEPKFRIRTNGSVKPFHPTSDRYGQLFGPCKAAARNAIAMKQNGLRVVCLIEHVPEYKWILEPLGRYEYTQL